MKEDLETQQHAQIIAREWNFCDVENLKTERTTTKETSTSSVWLATGNHNIRCFVQYDADQMPDID